MNERPVHFEIHASDPEKLANFYQQVFGWQINKWAGGSMEYWLVMTAEKEAKELGINGGLIRRRGEMPKDGAPVNSFVVTMQVADIKKTITKIEAAGGVCALPIFAIPGMAWQAYYKDLDGNIFGIHQPDEKAA